MKTNQHAGEVNLRGKKYKMLRCRCCSVYDLRDDYNTKQSKKEMREYTKERS